EGRFGIYITDGETNASLRGGDSVENIAIERASDLLAERRAAEPSAKPTKRTAVKKASTKTAKKKPVAKKTGVGKSTTATE
ncbi:MAG: hypothetical protein EBR84_03750, partial [Actinobacteria bacterium]|nr:hypothetical protein [Actinomycetota bacterium]